jgi:hypothetical protein
MPDRAPDAAEDERVRLGGTLDPGKRAALAGRPVGDRDAEGDHLRPIIGRASAPQVPSRGLVGTIKRMERAAAGAGPAIVQYWHSAEVPDYIAALLASFEEANRDLPHLIFDRHAAEELIGARLGARQATAFRACAVPAMQADYFRYCALHALGGVYADADFRCLAPLRALIADRDGPTLFGRPELPPRWRNPRFEWRERAGPYRVVMNSLFAFPSPGHPLLELAIEIATANVEGRIAEDVALVTGPAVFTALYLLRERGSFAGFLEYANGGVLEAGARLVCETIGDYDRVAAAFAGVSIEPEEASRAWVAGAETPLPYKETAAHWTNTSTSIFA